MTLQLDCYVELLYELDRAKKSTYVLRVAAIDGGRQKDEIDVTVRVVAPQASRIIGNVEISNAREIMRFSLSQILAVILMWKYVLV